MGDVREKVWFENGRGQRLAGVFTPAGPQRAVVMAHGFLSDKRSRGRFERLAARLAGAGVASLAFDFSGCGESDDEPVTLTAWEDDLRCAVGFVRARGFTRVSLLGHSLGGLVCLRAAIGGLESLVLTGSPTDAMHYDWAAYWSPAQMDELRATGQITVVQSTGLRARAVVDGRMLEQIDERDPRALLAPVACPVLLVAGDGDGEERAILAQARRAIAALPAGSRLVAVEGAPHGFGDKYDVVLEAVADWFAARR